MVYEFQWDVQYIKQAYRFTYMRLSGRLFFTELCKLICFNTKINQQSWCLQLIHAFKSFTHVSGPNHLLKKCIPSCRPMLANCLSTEFCLLKIWLFVIIGRSCSISSHYQIQKRHMNNKFICYNMCKMDDHIRIRSWNHFIISKLGLCSRPNWLQISDGTASVFATDVPIHPKY